MNEVKRGRPPKELKKGRKSWTPSNLTDVLNKEDGYRYRWARKDPDNIAKKHEEGWETVSGINSPQTRDVPVEGRPDEPKNLTSTPERRDAVLMRLDEETAQLRDAYHNQRTARLESMLKKEAGKDLAKEGARLHGEITKDRLGIKTIID